VATALGRHLVLIGFMGAGKTTLGADAAARLGRPFIDLDAAIEAEHGPIPELFERQGEAAFRELEARFLHEACAQLRGDAGDRQVRRPLDVAVVGNGGGPVAGCLLLTRE